MDNRHQKAGYLDVKFPPKSRGLKVKAWRRRWVVVHQMKDLAERQTMAKLDIYLDELSESTPHAEKTTIILENITSVRRTKSKTHVYAFQIVDKDVLLNLSGSNESDSQSWMIVMRNILWPRQLDPPQGSFEVSVVENRDSLKIELSGSYWLHVSPSALTLMDITSCRTELSWRLCFLKRFYLATTPMDGDTNQILVIQAGQMADTGEGEYVFYSPNAKNILLKIRDSIQEALTSRQSRENLSPGQIHRPRTVSTTSSVLHYKILLDSNQHGSREKSPSESLSSTPPSTPDTPPPLPLPRHPMSARSSSLPQNIAFLRKGSGSYSPPRLVLETKTRRQTVGELSKEASPDVILRTSRSAEAFSKLTAQNTIIEDQDRSSPVPVESTIFDNKPRTVSVSSNVSRASGSITSRDSGIMFNVDRMQIEEEDSSSNVVRDTSNSFDSAVSTSGPADEQTTKSPQNAENVQIKTTPTDEDPAPLVSTTENDSQTDDTFPKIPEKRQKRISVVSNIYADIPSRKTSTVSNEYAAIPADLVDNTQPNAGKLHRSHSAGRIMGDNDYEELDSFRKDLKKHIDFNPNVNKRDEPPALPERPSSIRVVRRQRKTPRHVRASKVASMFVKLPRKSSDSSSDDGGVNALISKVHNWSLPDETWNTEHKGNGEIVYNEIDKRQEDSDNIIPRDIAGTGHLVAFPPFDLISPPPVSCQLDWGNKDLLSSSPSKNLQNSTFTPIPRKDIFDFEFMAGTSPEVGNFLLPMGSESLLLDEPGERPERRRSSTVSCPCPDERCKHNVTEKDSTQECSRSFSEVSGQIFRHQQATPEPLESTGHTYECMSGPCSPDITDSWADFDSVFGKQTAPMSPNAVDSMFALEDLNPTSVPETNPKTVGGQSLSVNTTSSPDLGDLIDWGSSASSTADDTYLDMSATALPKE